MYTMCNVVVRYSYVYNQRIVFEDFADECLRKSLCGLTFVLSGSLCLLANALGMRPDQYLILTGAEKVGLHRKAESIFTVLVAVSIAVNVALTAALRRHSAHLDDPQEGEEEAMAKAAAMKKFLVALVIGVALAMIRVFTDFFHSSPFVIPAMFSVFLNALFALYIMSKAPLKKHVKKNLGQHGIMCGITNSVSPVL